MAKEGIVVPGQQYTITTENTLSEISLKAYGSGRYWPLIWKANQKTLKSGDPDLIFPGELIWVPERPGPEKKTAAKIDRTDKEKDDFTVVIGGQEIKITSAKLIRTMDTCCDGCTLTLPTDKEDKAVASILVPYSYSNAEVYIGNSRQLTGRLYGLESSLDTGGAKLSLELWSLTADLVDSTMRPPYEKNNVTLKQRADELVEPFGIKVIWELTETEEIIVAGKAKAKSKDTKDSAFKRATAEATETIFNHLSKLAAQRGLLITCDREGNLVFTQANVSGASVGTIEEGKPGTGVWSAKFDGRQRFSTYKVIADTNKDSSQNSIAKDPKVPQSRFTCFKAEEQEAGGIKETAEWRRSRQIVESMTFKIPVTDWYAPNGQLWTPNTIVTVISPAMFLSKGFDFLIKSVEFSLDDKGRTAELSIIPPNAYTGKPFDDPWSW